MSWLPVYDEISLKGGKVFKIVKNGKIGFFSNATGKIITAPVYAELSDFMYGMARVKIQDETGTHYGYVNDEEFSFFVPSMNMQTAGFIKILPL